MKVFIAVLSSVFIILFLQSCTGQPTGLYTATLLILVVDNDPQETPIPDIEVVITPGDIVNKTDTKGLCRFELKPGDYYVDAQVCCVGPGWIQYHESVNLLLNETRTLKLYGCLRCQ